ncbi:MAG: SnoaL-like domain [Thermoleophilaceae bacterium]|jgi:ketosteroid isomerase-like protein|nr:SnoaL-like domain [Thermoleophilaceae bacterium]
MSQENVEIVKAAFDAFNSKDAEALSRLWTEHGEWRPAFMGGGLVEGTVYYGKRGVAEFIAAQADTWETATGTPVTIREFGDRVLVEVLVSAVGRIGGTPVERTTWNVFEVHRGEIRSGRVYVSESEALEAVGLSE